MRKYIWAAVGIICALHAIPLFAAGPKVSDPANKHNLSSDYPGNTRAGLVTYYALDDPNNLRTRQICIFCHTPHSSAPASKLWNRQDTTQTFGRYSSPTLLIRRSASGANYAEPTGSSRLCLSCHDGVIALGALLYDPPNLPSIPMVGGKNFITGIAKFDKVKVQKGHHPFSFAYSPSVVSYLNTNNALGKLYTSPTIVKLDKTNQMQCMTCHDPHQNQSTETIYPGSTPPRKIAPFWAYGANNSAVLDHDAVCKTCHTMTKYYYGTYSSGQWPYP